MSNPEYPGVSASENIFDVARAEALALLQELGATEPVEFLPHGTNAQIGSSTLRADQCAYRVLRPADIEPLSNLGDQLLELEVVLLASGHFTLRAKVGERWAPLRV